MPDPLEGGFSALPNLTEPIKKDLVGVGYKNCSNPLLMLSFLPAILQVEMPPSPCSPFKVRNPVLF